MTNIQETDVKNVMKEVIDPELMVNVVDLGLLYGVIIDSDAKKIEIEMTLTSRGCPLGEMIVSNAQNLLETEFPEFSAEVRLVWEPRWTHEKMTPEGKAALGNR